MPPGKYLAGGLQSGCTANSTGAQYKFAVIDTKSDNRPELQALHRRSEAIGHVLHITNEGLHYKDHMIPKNMRSLADRLNGTRACLL